MFYDLHVRNLLANFRILMLTKSMVFFTPQLGMFIFNAARDLKLMHGPWYSHTGYFYLRHLLVQYRVSMESLLYSVIQIFPYYWR